MLLRKMLTRLPSLDDQQLLQARQGQKDQIASYARAILHYPPERMERYGKPFMDGLLADLARIEAEIARRR